MTRDEEIKEAAVAFCKAEEAPNGFAFTPQSSFIVGALWADSHPHWISVEDELPKKDDTLPDFSIYVLATDGNEIYKSFYDYSIGGWFDDNLFRLDNITHWMPLPAPPMEIRGNQRKISPNHQQVIGTADHIKIALDVIDKKGGEE